MATITKFHKFLENSFNGTAVIDFNTDTLKVMLVTSSYTPSQSTHDFINDANTNEVTGTNYTAGGATIASPTVTLNAGVVTVDGGDVTWTQSGTGFSNARYAIIYKDTTVAATSPVVGYIDFTSDKGNVNGDLTVQWNASGIFTVA
jgi:hypothetical protein